MKIFISWSKNYSGEIASVLKNWLGEAFSNNVDIFLSKEIGSGQKWRREISSELSTSDFGILVLTPENINSPWILFEAGSLQNKEDTLLCPMLFGRTPEQLEGPLVNLQFRVLKKSDFKCLLQDINKCVEMKTSASLLDIYLDNTWSDVSQKISQLIERSKDSHLSMDREGVVNSFQLGVDLGASTVFDYSDKKLTVTNQASLDVSSSYLFGKSVGLNLRVKDIPKILSDFVKFNIDPKYCKVGKSNSALNSFSQTVFIINRTRISNFVSFTDGDRIVLFDRQSSSALTTIKNNRLDVFGSVDFENSGLLNKIKNPEFEDSIISEINGIPGFAFEDNENKNLEKETVIMFGFSVTVSSDSLDSLERTSVDSNPEIRVISTSRRKPRSLTAKADMSFSYVAGL